MKHKGFKILSVINIIVLTIQTILLGFAYPKFKNRFANLNFLPEETLETLSKYSVLAAVTGVVLIAFMVASFVLIILADLEKISMRRWYFIPALIVGFLNIALVVGLIYLIIAIIDIIRAEVDDMDDDKANRNVLIVSIVYLVLGLPFSILPMLLEFDAALMSITVWLGISLLFYSISYLTYFAYKPYGEKNLVLKIVMPIVSLGAITGLFFLFSSILKERASRFDGDWGTILVCLVSALLIGAVLVVVYVIFGLIKKSSKASLRMLELAPVIAFIGIVLGNFIALYWVAIIEFLLNLGSIIIILKIFKFASCGSGASGSGSSLPSATSYHDEVETDKGTFTYQGNGIYRDASGNVWHSNDGENFTKD